jgi:hypothetical protein
MNTADRVAKLAMMPMDQAPKEAQMLIRFLQLRYGYCGELVMAAYEAYAIVIEGTVGGNCGKEEQRFLEAVRQSPAVATI